DVAGKNFDLGAVTAPDQCERALRNHGLSLTAKSRPRTEAEHAKRPPRRAAAWTTRDGWPPSGGPPLVASRDHERDRNARNGARRGGVGHQSAIYVNQPVKVGPAQRKPFMFPPWKAPLVACVYRKHAPGCGEVVADRGISVRRELRCPSCPVGRRPRPPAPRP